MFPKDKNRLKVNIFWYLDERWEWGGFDDCELKLRKFVGSLYENGRKKWEKWY